MIELNFCALNFKLRKNIINRGEEDYKTSELLRTQSFDSISRDDYENI